MDMSGQVGRTVEEALDGLQLFLDPADIAEALGIQIASVAAVLKRAGYLEEAEIFADADKKARKRRVEALFESQWGKTKDRIAA
jgi:hypothetical protein